MKSVYHSMKIYRVGSWKFYAAKATAKATARYFVYVQIKRENKQRPTTSTNVEQQANKHP